MLSSIQSAVSLLISAAVFAFHAYRLFRDLRLAHLARSWPRAICSSLEASVVERSVQGVPSYATKVSYAFEADGRSWTGDRLLFGQQTPMTRKKAEEQTRALLDNLPAFAIYNPVNPAISALSARAGVYVSALWCIGLCILVGAFAFALLYSPE